MYRERKKLNNTLRHTGIVKIVPVLMISKDAALAGLKKYIIFYLRINLKIYNF